MELDDVRALVQRQIDYNYAIAQGGTLGKLWGEHRLSAAEARRDDVKVRAKAYAAAGSDAG